VADFKPPAGVVNNAKQAIEWREKYPKETADAGTQTGWTRARQLANGESVSADIIGRMVSFFARHEGDETVAPEFRNEPWRDNGYLMHLAWGGDAGKTWANRIYKQIQNNKSFNTNNMNDIQYKSFEIKAFDKLKGIITGYGATYGNVDLTNEVVLQGSLDDDINAFTNGTKIIEFLYEHNSNIVFNSTVDSLKSDSIGMFTQASVSDVAKATYKVEWERFATYCSKGLGRMSIGYRTMNAYVIINGEKKYYIKDGQYDFDIVNMIDELKLIKYLEKLTLHEVSFTGNPANPQARILGIKNNRGRVAEEMEMPNFKTKSEFEMALEKIKNADITNIKADIQKLFVKMKKEDKLKLSHKEIGQFAHAIYKGTMQIQEIKKMLDNQNNDVKQNHEPHSSEAHSSHDLIEEVKTQTFADIVNTVAKNFKK